MAISPVGTFNSTSGTAITTKSVTTVAAGDLIVFYTLIAGVALTATALAGGTADAGGWTKRVEFACSNGDTIGMWTARVGTPGTEDVTVTWSGSPAGAFIGFGDKQWTAGLGAGTVWALDGAASGQNNASATTCAYPTKVPAGSGRLYAGYGVGHSVSLVAGPTSGYTYHVDVIFNCFLWNPNISASTSPTTGTTSPQASSAIGMLISAAPPPSAGPRQVLKQAGRSRCAAPRRGEFLQVPPAVADPNLPQVTDGGVGVDTFTIVEQVTVADSGTGVDTFVTGEAEFPSTGDTGVGVDTFTVLDVLPSTLLPLRTGPLYEVLVVAKIPAIDGPPTFITVDPIRWRSLDWTTELSKPQSLNLTCEMSTLTEDVIQHLRRPHAPATELWLLRDGQQMFAGPLTGGRRDGETLSLHADGLLAYLGRWVVYADQVFSNIDQFAIVKALVDHWQARPWGNYGIDTSAVGTSGVPRDATYLAKELHPILQRVQEMGLRINGFDVDVDPASRQLQLWYPTRGVDRSVGEDAVVFDSRNIMTNSLMFSVAPQDVATVAFGTGTAADAGGTLYGTAVNAELLAQYGASAITSTWDSVKIQGTLDAHVQGLLDARGAPLFVPGSDVRVTPDADLTSYGAGDVVSFEADGQLGVTGAFRLRSVKVSVVSEGGTELVSPTFV